MADETAPPETRAVFEQSILLRLDEISRQLERVLTMVCPVCGPDLVAQIHPDPVATIASRNGNGRGHGK